MNEAFSFMTMLMVALGGACGAMSRYSVGIIATTLLGSGFPYGTLIVNSLGSAVMGIAATFFFHKYHLTHSMALFLMVGFLGAFTTYSSFALETMNLFMSSQHHLALLNAFLNVSLSVLCVFLGMLLMKNFL